MSEPEARPITMGKREHEDKKHARFVKLDVGRRATVTVYGHGARNRNNANTANSSLPLPCDKKLKVLPTTLRDAARVFLEQIAE